jgi:hypothetical protein
LDEIGYVIRMHIIRDPTSCRAVKRLRQYLSHSTEIVTLEVAFETKIKKTFTLVCEIKNTDVFRTASNLHSSLPLFFFFGDEKVEHIRFLDPLGPRSTTSVDL